MVVKWSKSSRDSGTRLLINNIIAHFISAGLLFCYPSGFHSRLALKNFRDSSVRLMIERSSYPPLLLQHHTSYAECENGPQKSKTIIGSSSSISWAIAEHASLSALPYKHTRTRLQSLCHRTPLFTPTTTTTIHCCSRSSNQVESF